MSLLDSAYEDTPPWYIGRAQKKFVPLSQAGEIHGLVLDVGCGTVENELYLVQLGHEVWGIDATPAAIDKAKKKARQHRIKATFLVADALDLKQLRRRFDTIIGFGLFHVFLDRGVNHEVLQRA